MENWHRECAVAGRFYPAEPSLLKESIASFCPGGNEKKQAIGVMAPHAGYIYSGKIAGVIYKEVSIPDRVIILCPNHTGRGKRRSVWPKGSWRTPLGEVPVDEEAAKEFLKATDTQADREAHLFEHAIEVHLPFLLHLNPRVRIVPVVLGLLAYGDCRGLGDHLAEVVKRVGQETTLLIASTDMSHYLSADEAKVLDKKALAKVEALDSEGLYEVVRREQISMCGFIPTCVVLQATRRLGGTCGTVVDYGTSGERTGDFSSVVAYASACLL